MKHNKSFILRLGMLLVVALFSTVMFTSCSDDDLKTPLQQPSLMEGVKTVSSIAFSWEPVEGASQYAYELYDTNEQVVLGGVTNTTSVLTTGLKPKTEYTLKVWAYSPVDGKHSTSPIATITSVTNPQIPLVAPTSAESATGNGGVTITWPAVEHATAYKYTLSNGTTGETSTNSVTLTSLAIGEYTISIVATSSDETYSDSEPFAFTFQRTKSELWRKDGVYTAANLPEGSNKFNAEIVAYDDGSYTIVSPYGAKGFDISFTVDPESSEIKPIGTESFSGYEYVWVSMQYDLGMFCGNGYSGFEGNKQKGSVWFYAICYDADGNDVGEGGQDTFTWGGDTEVTVDKLCGTYNAHVTGYDYFSSTWELQEVDRTDEVTITKIDDTTVKISNFYGWGEDFTGTVDLDAKTITIQPVLWNTYYTFASIESATAPVVATFANDLTITFQNFTAWADGYSYIESDARCEMSQK
ncbi:fibronectin type III domain-containing protein [uncultured Prevotella sp.]|uniref:fibronectin type III domain-containing protein n=1 Tax=uncultured Prevotella sp. TaxID=159272 RepID=UPI002619214A|nr:fibronectin type III domain-containing protein [uncultured Prevotella sp.]